MGFDTYVRKQNPEIQALKQEDGFTLNGQTFVAGDYIVKNADGSLEGRNAAEFEAEFALKVAPKKTWSRKKKVEAPVQVAEATA